MPTEVQLPLRGKRYFSQLSVLNPKSWKLFVKYFAETRPSTYNHSDCWVEDVTVDNLIEFLKTYKTEFFRSENTDTNLKIIEGCFEELEKKFSAFHKDNKHTKANARYQTSPYADGRKCGNCQFSYKHHPSAKYICTQVTGYIQPNGACVNHKDQAQPA